MRLYMSLKDFIFRTDLGLLLVLIREINVVPWLLSVSISSIWLLLHIL